MKIMIYRFSLLILFVVSCSRGGSDDYTIIAEHQFDNVKIRIGLIHNHPYLAEYKKFLEIISDNGLIKKEELFIDSGGYSWVAIYKSSNGELVVQDFGNKAFIIDVNDLKVHQIGNKRIPSWQYLGRFDFDRTNGKKYRFISSVEDRTEPISRVKGG